MKRVKGGVEIDNAYARAINFGTVLQELAAAKAGDGVADSALWLGISEITQRIMSEIDAMDSAATVVCNKLWEIENPKEAKAIRARGAR